MKYEFNKSYFSQLCAERKLTNVALQKALNMTNTTPINRWRAGEDIRSDHIVRICNAYDVSPAEFFLCNAVPVQNPTIEVGDINSQQEQIAFLYERLKSEKEKCELYQELREYNRNKIATLESNLRELESTLREYKDEIIALRKQLSANIKHVE